MATRQTTGKKTAAKKKAATKTTPGKELARPEDVRASLAKFAKAAQASEKHAGGGNFISTKGGEFTYQGDALDDPLRSVIVDFAHVNTYYDGPYDSNNPTPPACFAIAKSAEDPDEDVEYSMAPHEDAADPQAATCRECWANAFGSDARGRGKACKNTRRLALVSAGDGAGGTKLDGVNANAEVAMLSISPAGLKYWSGFVKKLASVKGLPPFAVVTDLSIVELTEGFTVKPTVVEELPDEAIAEMLELRMAAAADLLQPFQVQADEAPQKPRTGRRGPAGKKKATPAKKAPDKKKRAKF